jgi:hypothetical protein
VSKHNLKYNNNMIESNFRFCFTKYLNFQCVKKNIWIFKKTFSEKVNFLENIIWNTEIWLKKINLKMMFKSISENRIRNNMIFGKYFPKTICEGTIEISKGEEKKSFFCSSIFLWCLSFFTILMSLCLTLKCPMCFYFYKNETYL